MGEIVEKHVQADYDGPIRPDHGRMIWHEQGWSGYGLFDRAVGATYLLGLGEGIIKTNLKHLCDKQ